MGHPSADPEYGNDCLTCFAAGETPLHVYAGYAGIVPCHPDDPLGLGGFPEIWTMTQESVRPCYWYGGDPDGWNSRYSCDTGHGSVLELWKAGAAVFRGWDNHIKATSFTNIQNCVFPPAPAGEGFGQALWVPAVGSPSVHKIMELLNMAPTERTLHEHWPAPDGEAVLRLARSKDSTCIHILFDPGVM